MNLPEQFLKNMELLLDKESLQLFRDSMEAPVPQSIRRNPSKQVPNVFDASNLIPWDKHACYLSTKHSFIRDPEWHSGSYYVQEAASMIIGGVVQQLFPDNKPIRAIDLCAAPGGKSTQLLSVLPEGSVLLANETDKKRYSILQENLLRWGYPNILVSNANSMVFSKSAAVFDLAVVDAPCSGEGMMRKDEQAVSHWNNRNVQSCHIRQKEILKNVVHAIKPGGVLIYSTCTFNKSENEEIGDWLVDTYGLLPIDIKPDPAWGISRRRGSSTSVWVCYPHKVMGEGFAFQVFRVPELNQSNWETSKPVRNANKVEAQGLLKELLDNTRDYVLNKHDSGDIYLSRDDHSEMSNWRNLFGIHQLPGICIGQYKGKDFIPGHGLALSILLSPDLPAQDLELDQALGYLKGETNLPAPAEALEKGWFLVKYRNQPLGWAKKVSGRVNNYLPKNWRIRVNL